MRHYNWKSLRYQGFGAPFLGIDPKVGDGKVEGLVVVRGGNTQDVLAQLIVPNDSVRAQINKSFQSALDLSRLKSCTIEGKILKLTFPGDGSSSALLLRSMLGHAINL